MPKYFTYYRGYMIFRKSNGFYPPSIDEDITCNSLEETQKVIDLYLLSQKDEEIDDYHDSMEDKLLFKKWYSVPEPIADISPSLRWFNNIVKYKGPETLN